MSELRGQEQAPKVQPPERPSVAPAVPPVSSGAMPDNERQLDLLEAIQILADLRGRLEGEHWVISSMQRAIINGVRLSIDALEKAIKK